MRAGISDVNLLPSTTKGGAALHSLVVQFRVANAIAAGASNQISLDGTASLFDTTVGSLTFPDVTGACNLTRQATSTDSLLVLQLDPLCAIGAGQMFAFTVPDAAVTINPAAGTEVRVTVTATNNLNTGDNTGTYMTDADGMPLFGTSCLH